jgi:ABC-2 type transport system ATP-binding protein
MSDETTTAPPASAGTGAPGEADAEAEPAPVADTPAAAAGTAAERTPAGILPLQTRGLTKRYDEIVAVDDLALEVRAGEIFGLLGQNGAGKTTTILMLLGLTEPSAGQARVLGLDPTRHPLEIKRRVGYLPDAVGFYSSMTGRQNLRYTARLNGLRGSLADDRIVEALDQVGMTDRADTATETYSRGMLQRLGIADALIKDPAVLILDEPTTAIDPIGVIEILDLLRSLSRERGMTILLSSHLLNQVQSVCDRIGIFAAGKLIGVGTVEELATRFGATGAGIEVGFATSEDPPTAAAEAARIQAMLATIDGVAAVRPGAGERHPWLVGVVDPEVEARVQHEILVKAADDGLGLVSIRSLQPSLEDIYTSAVARRRRPAA